MARCRSMSGRRLVAVARQAIGRIARADDPVAAAEQVLGAIESREVRLAVVQMAAAAEDKVTGAVISAALRGDDSELARTAADLLAEQSGNPAALDVLRQCFEVKDASVRARAVEAIEGFDDPAAVEFFPRALTDEDPIVRRAAAGALGQMVASRYNPLSGAVLEALGKPDSTLARAVVENEDVEVRRQTAQAMGFVGSDAAVPGLKLFCRDEDPEVRQETVIALAALPGRASTDLIASNLEDPSYAVVSSVLDTLAGRLPTGSSELLEYLKRTMRHPRVEVRRQAVLMLSEFGPDEAGPLLEEATGDADFEVARRASETIRVRGGPAGTTWLADGLGQRAPGDRTLSVWEAGNTGLAAGSRAAALVGESGAVSRDVVAMIEGVIERGSSSDKLHAVNELSGLVDICDSASMCAALDDADSSVRARAADALWWTRDAGLLLDVLRSHADATARRVAIGALAANPGGRPGGAPGGLSEFASARTLGTDLYSIFLSAVDDPDEGVQQHACEALREFARNAPMLPVGRTLEVLEGRADADDASVLIQEEADYAAETVRETKFVESVIQAVGGVFEWHSGIAGEARALRLDPESGRWSVAAAGEDAARRWDGYGLSAEQLAASGQGLEDEAAQALMRGLTDDLCAVLQCVAAAARAVRLIGQEERAGSLDGWASALGRALQAEWGGGEDAAALELRVDRRRKAAFVEVLWAREALGGESSRQALAELAEEPDDWVALFALRALAGLDPQVTPPTGRLGELCLAHRGEADYAEPVGRAAVALLESGAPGAAEAAASALADADLDLRMTLTQKLIVAAQGETAGAALRDHLRSGAAGDVAGICLLMALQGAGRELEGLAAPEAAEDDTRAALLGLRAMRNEIDAADELEAMLRDGKGRERYLAACCLTLARVKTAVPIFAGVRDSDAPYLLRALCAASSVRRGHPGGDIWFDKVMKSVGGRVQADLVAHLCRAVEDTIPLMLQCAGVNVGRFV